MTDKYNHLVIGKGEIGTAVEAVLGENVWNYDIKHTTGPRPSKIDVLHICFPYSDTFIQDVQEYIIQFNASHIVIYSTVPIYTCKKIDSRVVHSPVESRHPDLETGIRSMIRWIGAGDKYEADFFKVLFIDLGLRTKVVGKAEYTEALKLLSTTEYGVNIVFADYKKRVADEISMDFELTKDWNRDYNSLYKHLGLGDRFQKYVLDPPNGKIGGHCVRENSILLNDQYPDEWVKRIGEMG